MHEYIRLAIIQSPAEALKQSTHKAPCARIDLDAIRAIIGDGAAHWEIAFEYDLERDVAGVIFPDGHRGYERKEGMLYGTADIVIERGAGLEVYDVKTGADVGAPATNWQLLTLALMVCRTYKVDTIRVGIIYVSPVTGAVEVSDALLTAMDIDDARDQIRLAMAAVDGDPIPGSWCRYCHARADNCLVAA